MTDKTDKTECQHEIKGERGEVTHMRTTEGHSGGLDNGPVITPDVMPEGWERTGATHCTHTQTGSTVWYMVGAERWAYVSGRDIGGAEHGRCVFRVEAMSEALRRFGDCHELQLARALVDKLARAGVRLADYHEVGIGADAELITVYFKKGRSEGRASDADKGDEGEALRDIMEGIGSELGGWAGLDRKLYAMAFQGFVSREVSLSPATLQEIRIRAERSDTWWDWTCGHDSPVRMTLSEAHKRYARRESDGTPTPEERWHGP